MLLITTDIFGVQPQLLQQLDRLAVDYLCVQPYDQPPPVFTDDQQAYQYFLQHSSPQAYTNKLKQIVETQTNSVFLVGFSAGAAACWNILALPLLPVRHCLCFYGGQIRQLSGLQPLYPVELIFTEETHFSVKALMETLADKIGLTQQLVPYAHGFMNPLSAGYQVEAAEFFWQKIKAGLKNQPL
jgi:dienelactone hydrolase